MSWMRWPVYVWGGSNGVHLWARAGDEAEKAGVHPIEDWCLTEGWSGGLSMPQSLFDELVVARFAELVDEGLLPRVLRRLKSKKSHVGGNMGGWAIREALGLNPAGEFRALVRGSRLEARHATLVRCPTCKARKGDRCMTATFGAKRVPHAARVAAREAAIQREIAKVMARQDGAS